MYNFSCLYELTLDIINAAICDKSSKSKEQASNKWDNWWRSQWHSFQRRNFFYEEATSRILVFYNFLLEQGKWIIRRVNYYLE